MIICIFTQKFNFISTISFYENFSCKIYWITVKTCEKINFFIFFIQYWTPKVNLNLLMKFLTYFMWIPFGFRENRSEILTNFCTWNKIRCLARISLCMYGDHAYWDNEIIPQLSGCVMWIDSSTAPLIELGIATRSSTQRQPDFTWRSFQKNWMYWLTFLHLSSSFCITQSRISLRTASLLVWTARKDFMNSWLRLISSRESSMSLGVVDTRTRIRIGCWMGLKCHSRLLICRHCEVIDFVVGIFYWIQFRVCDLDLRSGYSINFEQTICVTFEVWNEFWVIVIHFCFSSEWITRGIWNMCVVFGEFVRVEMCLVYK